MIILPAIDIKDGACVRLRKGEFDTVHTVTGDPEGTARDFFDAGARWIHMVDLDGAKNGVRKNSELVRRIAALGTLRVELGGGLRTMADLEEVRAMGVSRMVIGSAAAENPDFAREAAARFGEAIAVGIDSRDGMVRTAGWTENSGLRDVDFAREMEKAGVSTIIFTDIETDGMLSGPSFGRLRELRKAVSCRIIASGGVTTLDDIRALRDMGIDGAIIGKAYYAGTIDLREAVREAGDQA